MTPAEAVLLGWKVLLSPMNGDSIPALPFRSVIKDTLGRKDKRTAANHKVVILSYPHCVLLPIPHIN